MNYNYIRQLTTGYELILGSRSPRRVKLLKEIDIEFKQVIPNLEEARNPGESPYEYARRLAEDKALLVAKNTGDRQIVLGCDTIVVLNDQVLEKPSTAKEAFEILSSLAGNKHTVCTALALAEKNGIIASDYELTDVYFNKVTDRQINDYIATGEPMDKAGAYGIQGMGAFLVDRIAGQLDNVIGLPRNLLNKLAKKVVTT